MKIFSKFLLFYILISWFYQSTIQALDYPGKDPGKTHCSVKPGYAILNVEESFSLILEPFEVMVIELPDQKNEGKNSSYVDW